MSYMRKPMAAPGIYPIPGFADRYTLNWAGPYNTVSTPNQAFVGGPLCMVRLVDRTMAVVADHFWSFGSVALALTGGRIGVSKASIPNGAEYWAVVAPTPPNAGADSRPPVANRFSLRFELHT